MRLIDRFWHTLEPSPAEIDAEIEANLAVRKARRQINSERSIKGHSTRVKNAVAMALSVFGDRNGTTKTECAGRLQGYDADNAASRSGAAL